MTSSSITKLHHFTTGQCVNENDANRIISIIEDGNKQYVKFREERFVKKEKKLSDTIKKIFYPQLNRDRNRQTKRQ